MKNILISDHPFLENYIHHCYIAREHGQPCRIVIPNEAKFPPDKTPDGVYNFNSKLINTLFSYFPESYQDTLLSLYTEKDGVKDYTLLKNAIAEILEKNMNDYKNGYF